MSRDETMSRLRAELNFNASRADHEPVTDSSLTYGDLRAFQAILGVSAHKLADMLRDSEPHRQPDDGSTEMEITVDDARRIGWALIGYAPDRDEILSRLRASLTAPLGQAISDMVRDTDAAVEGILSGRQGSGANTSEGQAPRDTLNTDLPHESKSPDHG